MTSVKDFFIGLGVGLVLLLVVWLIYVIRLRLEKRRGEKNVENTKEMLSSRMELESSGLDALKKENEKLKKENENMRITIQTLSQKPGRKEVERLQVYQKAVDRLTINSPGFGPAWQASLKESEEEFEKTYSGISAFIKKVIPGKTDAELLDDGSKD